MYYMPYQSVYEKEGRLSEHDLNRLIGKFIKKQPIINNDILAKIELFNLEPLNNTNSLRGAMIKGYELEKLPLLKSAGIRRIASLMKCPELEDECKKYNMEYLYFDIDKKSPCMESKQAIASKSRLFWGNIANIKDKIILENKVMCDVNIWSDKSRKSIDQFIDFIKFMQKDNVYIGCACGTYRTDFAVMLNSLFNPAANYDYVSNVIDELQAVENLFHNLTESDKLKMGWSKAFDSQFLHRLNKLKIAL